MKRGNKLCLIFLVLIFSIIFSAISFVSAEVAFNASDVKTWENAGLEQLKTISAATLASEYVANKEIIEKLWDKFNPVFKNDFIELKTKIKAENLGHIDLKLKGNILSSGKLSISIDKLPQGLQSLKYDPQFKVVSPSLEAEKDHITNKMVRKTKVSIYDFGNGNKIILEEGSLNEKKELSGLENADLNGVKVSSTGVFILHKEPMIIEPAYASKSELYRIDFSGEFNIDDVKYKSISQNPEDLASINFVSKTRAYLNNQASAESSRGIVYGDVLAIFDDNPISKEEVQYAKLGEHELKIVGSNIKVDLKQDYDSVQLSGKNLVLKNGDVPYILDEKGNFMIPTDISSFKDKYNIKELTDPHGNVYTNTHIGSESLLKDVKGYVNVGNDILKKFRKPAVKIELNVPEGSEIDPKKLSETPKTLTMTFLRTIPVDSVNNQIKSGMSEEGKKKIGDILGILGGSFNIMEIPGTVGETIGDAAAVVELNRAQSFLLSKGVTVTDSNRKEKIVFQRGSQLRFSTTLDGKAYLIAPDGTKTEFKKSTFDRFIQRSVDKYENILKKN